MSKEKKLTIALAKGRLAEKTMDILEKVGVDCTDPRTPSRKLVFRDETNNIDFIMVKPTDVPVYVDHGVADIGVAGKDTLLEADLSVYEMIDLKIAACRLCVAGYPETKKRLTSSILRVATKYPNVAKKHYAEKHETIEIIKLNGSIELAPILGLSDVIVDIVESGKTLKENGLVVTEDVADISARLIVNRVSLKTKSERINPLIGAIKAVINKG
jgi:ATP phosphoribosyltransferase